METSIALNANDDDVIVIALNVLYYYLNIYCESHSEELPKNCYTFFTNLFFLESVKELYDVCGGADVDEEELGELVVGELPLGQHPTSDDEDQ